MVECIENLDRLSTCIDKSLAQLRNKEKILYYSITENDLFLWEACPLCRSQDVTRISEVYLDKGLIFFTTDICKKCMHIFRSISPNKDWFVDCWKRISTGELCVYNKALEQKRRVRYEMYYSLLYKYKTEGLLLDVGAAYGSGTSVFMEKGFNAEALEPEHDRAEYIKQVCKINVYGCTIEDFDPIDKKYDIIIFSHCLEHINDPVGELFRLKNWLTHEGILYLEIPIAWKVIDWQDSLFMAHKHNFVEENIKKILQATGYVILDTYLIPDNDAPFCNLALVVAKDTSSHHFKKLSLNNKKINLLGPQDYSLKDLENLYRIQLPAKKVNKTILKFNVPFINHFYHIIRSDRNKFVFDGEFISYS